MMNREDVRSLLQSDNFDKIEFFKTTKAINLDSLEGLIKEAMTECRCELSDVIEKQCQFFVNLYDDISLERSTDLENIKANCQIYMKTIENYIDELSSKVKRQEEERIEHSKRRQDILNRNAIISLKAAIQCCKEMLRGDLESHRFVFTVNLIKKIQSSSPSPKLFELYTDFEEAIKVKLEQMALSCLYAENKEIWKFVCKAFFGLENIHGLADIFYKARVLPMLKNNSIDADNVRKQLSKIQIEIGTWTELQEIAFLDVNTYHTSFVLGVVWKPIADILMSKQELYSPTNHKRFHESFIAVEGLVGFFELELVKSTEGLLIFRSDPFVQKLKSLFQCNVYFQLLFRQQAAKFEQCLAERELKWSGLETTAREILTLMWDDDEVFLQPLLAKTFRFSLQLFGRLESVGLQKLFDSIGLSTVVESTIAIKTGLERLFDLVKSSLQSKIHEEQLFIACSRKLDEYRTKCLNRVDELVQGLPKQAVESFMKSIEGFINGQEDIETAMTRCIEGLRDPERSRVLDEFIGAYLSKAQAYLDLAVKKENNWLRLQSMANEEDDLRDVKRPEAVSGVKERLLKHVDVLLHLHKDDRLQAAKERWAEK